MRRTLGVVGAVVVAALGIMLLVGYVRGAEDRALAGEELVPVLVVDQAIAPGTPVETLQPFVHLEEVPAKVRAAGGIDSFALLDGLVTSVELVPGEQLIVDRFVAPETLLVHTRVEAPPDLLEVTVSLSPERALGGQLLPGDTIAVIASFDPFEISATEPSTADSGEVTDDEIFVGSSGGEDGNSAPRTPNSSNLILYDVLVTNIQVEQLPRTPEDGEAAADAPELAPTGNLLITLAAAPGDVEKIVFTAEHGFLWFAAQGDLVTPVSTPVQTRGTIYR